MNADEAGNNESRSGDDTQGCLWTDNTLIVYGGPAASLQWVEISRAVKRLKDFIAVFWLYATNLDKSVKINNVQARKTSMTDV